MRKPAPVWTAEIEDLSHDGRGVARVDGKTVFVDGALPGETATFQRKKKSRKFDEAMPLEIENPSADRVEPKCPHFGTCGGCTMQHLAPEKQILAKQKVLADNFERLGRVEPEEWLPPLQGRIWNYRRRARLGVKDVRKKGRVLVGFRERHAPYIAEIDSCDILAGDLGNKLLPLSDLVGSLSIPDRIPQFEVSVADNATAVVVRHLDPLTSDDLMKLSKFGEEHELRFYLQSKGPDTITPLEENVEPLYFDIPAHDIRMQFEPSDFIQVNADLNERMIDRALKLLQLDGSETVLDLFCGLGNFTLPLAKKVQKVVGVEGEAGLVQRARDNAARNGIENVEFHVANLFEEFGKAEWAKHKYDRLLLDPPRAGAQEICREMKHFAPERIVYVSCHPGTLARDAGILVHEQGYRLLQAGVMDMFPHTAHVESIAVFEKAKK
ncbi:MAG: 23S rRNA (uracil(1939)-C(5))-methyltransferase RlmD [Gammaproteobacteria bacterium]|nr:23S rRNA (uracil(1939)-C(5))-methyltransferase RlmD [Gammaproteobacteria bacterium]